MDRNGYLTKFVFFSLLNFFLLTAISAQESAAVNDSVAFESEETGPLKLSLEQISQVALNNSLDIQIAKFDANISRTELEAAESIFDTILTAQGSYSHDQKESVSSLAASDTRQSSFSLGLERKLPSGTTLSLDAASTKTKTDSSLNSLNPYDEAELGFSINQELGKNFFGLADRADIKITKLDIENSQILSLDNIEEALSEVQKAYWELVLRQEQLLISQEMLGEAEKLYQIYQEKQALGLVEKSELLAIKALLETRKGDFNLAQLARQTAKNGLLFLINRGDFNQDIVPLDRLDCSVAQADLYLALNKAVENRRDYQMIKNDLEKNKIDIVVKQNALWPQIDLEATFNRNNIDSGSGQAWGDLGSGGGDEFLFKLSFKLPLENRKARSQLRKADLEKSRFLLRFKRIERLLLREINNKVNRVNAFEGQVNLFRQTVQIHRQKLDYQIGRLNSGRSDSDTLIRYEEDLLKARLALAEYLFNYRVGLIELELAQNSLLDRYWQEPL